MDTASDPRPDVFARMRLLAVQMQEINARIAADRIAVAASDLAIAARTAWTYSQCALAQASAGLLPVATIEAIAAPDRTCPSERIKALKLSTLQAAERRLHRRALA